MEIVLDKVGKRFNREWIFKDFSFTFQSNTSYAIVGANGSGKSTLLQVIAGIQPASAGEIVYKKEKTIEPDLVFRYLSLAAPYLELVEEFTLAEHVAFHRKFKTFKNDISDKEFIEQLRLEKSTHKYIKNFSSGMKQRFKLGLAFYAATPILLLDEPTSNLDAENIAWYKEEVLKCRKDRMIIICSNQPEEYDFCEQCIRLT